MCFPRVTAGGTSGARDPTRVPCRQSVPTPLHPWGSLHLVSPLQTRDLTQEEGYGLWEGPGLRKEVEATLGPTTTHPYPTTNGTFLS